MKPETVAPRGEGAHPVAPVDLRRMARSIAASYGDKGAIVLTVGEDGIRIGVEGLSFKEVQEALCAGIHCNMLNAEGGAG